MRSGPDNCRAHYYWLGSGEKGYRRPHKGNSTRLSKLQMFNATLRVVQIEQAQAALQ